MEVEKYYELDMETPGRIDITVEFRENDVAVMTGMPMDQLDKEEKVKNIIRAAIKDWERVVRETARAMILSGAKDEIKITTAPLKISLHLHPTTFDYLYKLLFP